MIERLGMIKNSTRIRLLKSSRNIRILFTSLPLIVFLMIFCCLGFAQEMTAKDEVVWTAQYPTPELPVSGLPLLPDVTHYTIYCGQPGEAMYNHGPRAFKHDGLFVVYWCSHEIYEAGPGTRLLSAYSKNGEDWSQTVPMFDSLTPMKPKGEFGTGLYPKGFEVVDGCLYAIASAKQIMDWPNGLKGGPKYEDLGVLVLRVKDGRPYGSPSWLYRGPAQKFDSVKDMQNQSKEFIDDAKQIAKRYSLRSKRYSKLPETLQETKLCEPTYYTNAKGQEVGLFRDDKRSMRMFVSVRDNADQPWPTAVITNIPDSVSKPHAGNLPDGSAYLLGNHVPKLWRRDPLTLALSKDGKYFSKVWAVRYGSPRPRNKQPGDFRGPGYQYPDTVIADDYMWMFYSIAKEHIAVTKVPLEVLKFDD